MLRGIDSLFARCVTLVALTVVHVSEDRLEPVFLALKLTLLFRQILHFSDARLLHVAKLLGRVNLHLRGVLHDSFWWTVIAVNGAGRRFTLSCQRLVT